MAILQNLLVDEDREASAAAMPATFGTHYLLERAVSTGAMSVVWRAKDLRNDAPVALKFFPPQFVDHPGDLAAARELTAAAGVQQRGLITAHDLVVSGRYAAFVAPWVEGPTLRQMLYARPERFFEVEDLRRWLAALAVVIETAHTHGIVHGALDPDVVIQQAGEIYVVGFGTNAWLRHQSARRGGRLVADDARPYLSPTQRRRELPRPSDDVFALGALTYEMLVGSPPRTGRWWRPHGLPTTMAGARRRNGHRGSDIPPLWERVVMRSLHARERDRIGSVREFRMRLELGEPPVASASVASPTPAPPATVPASPPVAEATPAPQTPPPDLPDVFPAAPAPVTPAARPALRGTREMAESAAPTAARDHAGSHLHGPGVFWLRSSLALAVVATIAIGSWLAVQVYERQFAAVPPVGPVLREVPPEPEILPQGQALPAPVAPSVTETRPDAAPIEQTGLQDLPNNGPSATSLEEPPISPLPEPEPAPAESQPPPPPAVGSLEVDSDPPGAVVLVGDRPPQRTPFRVEDLSPGNYVLKMSLPGYAPVESSIEIRAGAIERLHAPLQRLTGLLHVTSNVEGVPFSARSIGDVEEAQTGVTPAELRVSTGRYLVRFHRPDEPSRLLVIDVMAEKTVEAHIDFPEPPPEPPAVVEPEHVVAATPAPSAPVTSTAPSLAPSEAAPGLAETKPESVPAPTPPTPALVPDAEIARPTPQEERAPPSDAKTGPSEAPPFSLDARIHELGEVDVAPRLQERVNPELPGRYRDRRVSGRVELVLVIDRSGRVASAMVKSTTDERLVEPTLRAVQAWRFSPATKNGRAVSARVVVPLVIRSE